MKRKVSMILGFLVMLFIVITPNPIVNAEETSDSSIHSLYQEAIEAGKVDVNKYSYNAFQENYNLVKKDYDIWKNTIGQDLTYNQWFGDIANYGAFPDGEGHAPSEKKTGNLLQASQTTNGEKLKNAIQKGDILIISSGGFGHAAIATSDNYILEMSGGGNILNWAAFKISNNNNQFSKHNWIFGVKEQGVKSSKHINNWIQLWRIPDKSMANRCANYADKTFWNSQQKYTKNRYIDYRVTGATTTLNPNYCSKLIFQAYYYGSGSASVIQPSMVGLSFISPSALPNVFTGKYTPYKVGTY
ncbi:hypothetical protein HCA00_08070 [Listeria booriae]|uniref:hypothetical protein n=1 Tax=Listeria booriae TaxID=1552123 RepID=UPI001625BC8A|nr:hypothetical protein [Listeria booriae]MBC1946100.1 hypothetical protein [Listeria booriae]MBC6128751.1 hypothetical protein [Listeria booriae]MBC6167950.1 hypothetical protein [Listeria booriae]